MTNRHFSLTFSLSLALVVIAMLTIPAASEAAPVRFRLSGVDSFGQSLGLGGVLSGSFTIDADLGSVYGSASNMATGNAYLSTPGVVLYTANGTYDTVNNILWVSSFWVKPIGGIPQSYVFDNLMFVLDAPLDGSVSEVHFGAGSARYDYYGDVIGISGTFTAVPEPASLSLLGIGGLAAIAGYRRRTQV